MLNLLLIKLFSVQPGLSQMLTKNKNKKIVWKVPRLWDDVEEFKAEVDEQRGRRFATDQVQQHVHHPLWKWEETHRVPGLRKPWQRWVKCSERGVSGERETRGFKRWGTEDRGENEKRESEVKWRKDRTERESSGKREKEKREEREWSERGERTKDRN